MALIKIIKKDFDDDNLIWRFPNTKFNTSSQLIVHEAQEAIFFSNGKALDLFQPGKYTLETNNIPLLRKLINIPTGGKSAFQCEVYFIDKSEKTMKWGTKSRIEFLEPTYQFPISIGACGDLRFTIEDSRKILLKLVGIKKNFDFENIDDFFESQILVKVKNYIADVITEEKISIFEIDKKLVKFSEEIQEKLENDFKEFGIKLDKFFIATISKPEEDEQYLRFKKLYFDKKVAIAEAGVQQEIDIIKQETEKKKEIIASEARKQRRNIEGYSYQEEQAYNIGGKLAENEGVGEFANVGVGLGMISGVGVPLSNQVSKEVSNAFTTMNTIVCPNCNRKIESNSKVCKYCGTKLAIERTCPKCGTPATIDAIFCSQCGERLG